MADKGPEPSEAEIPSPKLTTAPETKQGKPVTSHPSGKEGHGRLVIVLRACAFELYFLTCCMVIVFTQLIGAPLYFFNKEWYYAYMSMTKRSFGLVITVATQVWGSTTIRISGDASVAGQLTTDKSGNVRFKFPERLVMIANHQIYTDWLYLWWVAYANSPSMHGHIYIILKESLKYIPFIGTGMMFYGFIFMSRKMATDRPRLAHRLNKLRAQKTDPNGKSYFDPMWMLLFPEGTNLSGNGRRKSANWAAKSGLKDPEHLLLPRSTGSFFILNELKGSVEYVYDCTVAYEGVARGKYGEEIFGLSASYFEGRSPKSVNFYWRRFRLADIPLHDSGEFDVWMREEWYKKDALIEEYLNTGRFPAMADGTTDYIETQVRTRYPWEILQVFSVLGIATLVWRNLRKFATTVTGR